MLRFSRRKLGSCVRAIIPLALAIGVIVFAMTPAGYAMAEVIDLSVTVPCQPPDTPVAPFPVNGATGIPTSVILDWPDCANADTYDIYFGTAADPGYLASTAYSSYTMPVLSYGTTYYWRVVARNDCGETSGIVWSFITIPGAGGGDDGESSGGGSGGTSLPGMNSGTTPSEPGSPTDPGEQGLQLALLFWNMVKGPEMLWSIDENGATLDNVYGSSVGGTISINIPQGTVLKNADGEILTMIAVSRAARPPALPDGYTIIEAFEFQPRGASFDPYITLTINFDAMLGRTDLLSDQPLIAVYSPDAGEWIFLEGTIDYDRNEISFNVSHFSIYAIMAEVEPSTAPATSAHPNWILFAILWTAVLLLVILIGIRRRRIQAEPVEADASRYYRDTHR